MTKIKDFNSFNESKSPLDAEKVIISSYIKKSDWMGDQNKTVKDLIKKIAGSDVKVLSKVDDKPLYVIATGDEKTPTLEIPERFLLT